MSNFKLKKSEFMNLDLNKKTINEAIEDMNNDLEDQPGLEMAPDEETPIDAPMDMPVDQTAGGVAMPTVEMEPNMGGSNLKKLDPMTIGELTARLKDEYTAHYFYTNAANWCRDANYKKATAFFEAEALTELQHAKGLMDYMTDFNIIPTIPVTDTNQRFMGLVEIIEKAYGIELDLMNKYNESSAKLFTSDLTTFDFLQGYREIQKESVVEYNDLLNALELVDKNDKFQVLYFEQTYL
jgi:ferritin